MEIWLLIFFAGMGTFLMRTAGVWLPERLVPSRWLTYLPLAVILVMAIASLSGFAGMTRETLAMAIATVAVVLASLRNLPLFVCIGVGCVVFGMMTS